MKRWQFALVVGLVAVALSLGGQGDGRWAAAQDGPEAEPEPAPTQDAQADLVNCAVPDENRPLDDVEQQMIGVLNDYRAQIGVGPVELSPTLRRAAMWKARALSGIGIRDLTLADHDDADRTWDQRILDCGYPASAAFAENLAGSDGTLEGSFQAWRNSPLHDANMRNPDWTAIGLARALVADDFYYWVAVYGSEAR